MQKWILETERLKLRVLTLDDLDDLCKIFGDEIAMAHYPNVFNREETLGWINWSLRNYQQYGFGLWAVIEKKSGEFLGDCGITMQLVEGERIPEIGYHIRRDCWKKGFATEAATACKDYAFNTLGLKRVISWMGPENTASRRVAEKVGMHYAKETLNSIGKKAVIYEIFKEE